MPGWLDKATTALSRQPAAREPQPYRLQCACGGEVHGFRQSRPQQIICETCGEFLFVLPTNVYPRPKAPPPPRDIAAPPRLKEKRDRTVDTAPAGPPLSEWLRDRAGELQNALRSARSQAVAGARRLMTPLRLIAVAIVLVIAATAWWAVHLRGLERAEITLRESVRLAEASLAQQDYPAAAEQYSLAVAALDRLGRDDSHARAIRQMARETTAITALSSESLYEIAREGEQNLRKSDADWQQQFNFNHRGQWVVMDTMLSRAVDGDETPQLVADYPLALGPRSLEIRIDADAFPALNLDKTPRRALFAAQLESWRYDPSGSIWRVTLRPDTAFLWSNDKNYRALGLLTDEDDPGDTQSLLATQSQLLGVANE